jgi:hypothetical protein
MKRKRFYPYAGLGPTFAIIKYDKKEDSKDQ